MNNIGIRIEKRKSIKENIRVLIAILVEIAILSPNVHELVSACISNLVSQIETEQEKKDLIELVRKKLKSLPNIGHIQIWLQRFTYNLDKKSGTNPYQEPLCQLLEGNAVDLWNLEWLKDEFKKDIPILEICNTEKLKSMAPFIEVNEVSIFGY